MSQKTPALGFILVTVLIDVIGIGIIIPIFPKLLEEIGGLTTAEAAGIGALLVTAYAVMQFIFAPILGGISDQYGRRIVLLIALLGFTVDYLFLAFAPTIALFFVGRLFAGICGASFTTASAYVADISPHEKRAQNFGLIGAIFGLGFIIGPGIGGYLGGIDIRMPFYISAGLTFLNFLYGLFVLPESLPKSKRRMFSWKRANPIGSLNQLRNNEIILGLATALFFVYIAAHSVQSNWSYWGKEVFNWTPGQIGNSLMVVGILVALVQAVLIRFAVKIFGSVKTIYIGLIFNCIGLVLFSLATEVWMVYTFLAVYVLGGLAGPTLQGIMSSQVASDEQGELQGGLTSLVSLTSIIGPSIMGGVFYYFTKSEKLYFPGAAFALGAIFSLTCVLLTYRTLRNYNEVKISE